jgi:ABC-type glutathione transport system ATPase component
LYLFITHNIGVVEYIADHVAVMNRGRIEESGSATTVLAQPQRVLPDRARGLPVHRSFIHAVLRVTRCCGRPT